MIQESPAELKFLHGAAAPAVDGGASLFSWASVQADAFERTAKERHFERYRCATLLHRDEYQLVMVDAPAVPEAEMKNALRWTVKDRIDAPVEEVTFDVLDIPPVDAAIARGRVMFAVAAKNEVIAGHMRRFDQAHVPLDVIDIPETAQRNIAALYEAEKGGTALLFLGADSGLLTINFHGELYLARRIDVGFDHLMKYPPEARGDSFERIQLELQRTFDLFDRQHGVAITKVLLGPEPEDTGLEAHLRKGLDFAIERIDLSQRMKPAGSEAFDTATQWKMFHLAGAALRDERH